MYQIKCNLEEYIVNDLEKSLQTKSLFWKEIQVSRGYSNHYGASFKFYDRDIVEKPGFCERIQIYAPDGFCTQSVTLTIRENVEKGKFSYDNDWEYITMFHGKSTKLNNIYFN